MANRVQIVPHELALQELPDFTHLPGTNQTSHHEGFMSLKPSTDAIDRAWLQATAGNWPDEPLITMVIPSTKDGTLAPAGHHVMSDFLLAFFLSAIWRP